MIREFNPLTILNLLRNIKTTNIDYLKAKNQILHLKLSLLVPIEGKMSPPGNSCPSFMKLFFLNIGRGCLKKKKTSLKVTQDAVHVILTDLVYFNRM